MKKRILLVGLDLEPLVSELGQLTSRDEDWEFAFAASGREAFEALTPGAFDAAVVDVALPDIHGVEVLDSLKTSQPALLRFVYAPVSSDAAKLKQWGVDHYLLLKPCTSHIIYNQLRRALTLMLWLPGKAAHELISNLQTIPSPPALYNEVVRELLSPNGSMETVGQLISKDPAMTAKVLRLANSAAFGLHQKVTDPGTAVMYLGSEAVKSLILISGAFSYFEGFKPSGFSLPALWDHSFATGQCSRLIAKAEKMRGEMLASAYTAGLLHDLGKLVLAVNLPSLFNQAVNLAREHRITLWKIERDLMGVSHAEIGAALLGIWGLPNEIVQAVAWHHQPSRSPSLTFSPLTAVHVGNVVSHEVHKDNQQFTPSALDDDYLDKIGMAVRLPVWRDACVTE